MKIEDVEMGEKYRVRRDLVVGREYGNGWTFDEDMVKPGSVVTVEEIDRTDNTVTLVEDAYDKWYIPEMLEPLTRTLEDLREGDVLVDGDDEERRVLGVCGKVYLLSVSNHPDIYGCGYTVYEMEELGYTLKQPKEEIVELSMDEIAKLAGVPVERLKVKK